MKSKTMKKLVAAAVIAAMGVTSLVPAPQAQAAKVKKLTVKTKKVTLYKGAAAGYGSTQLKVTVQPKKAKVTYKTSNKKVATVTKKGLVKAKKAGKAKITVKAGTKKVVVKVTVKKIKKKVTKVTATQNMTVAVGKKQTIKTSVNPKKATLKKLSFTSNKKKIAKVSAKGVVTGVKEGNAKITVKAVDGSNKKATVAVVVTGAAIASSTPATGTATVAPTNAPSAVPGTEAPTDVPTEVPTAAPTNAPTEAPTDVPTAAPTNTPTEAPTASPAVSKEPYVTPVEPTVKDDVAQFTLDTETGYKMTFGTEDSALSSVALNEDTMAVFSNAISKLVVDQEGDLADAGAAFKEQELKDSYGEISVTKAAGSDTAKVVTGDDKTYDVTMTMTGDVLNLSVANEETGDDRVSLKAVQKEDGSYVVSDLEIAGNKASGSFATTAAVDDKGTTTLSMTNAAGETFTVSYGEGFRMDIPTAYMEKYNICVLQ